ncbi:hypothetical protein AMAG_15918 [Allomyces macrogynus ATCC 38327]|uniref:Uncharacterized protein n=1 Tax=Allomyces macrogynus (strain ATCC 38327) TaxID=578462 RepID=A0A0L0TB90_ALLM3|nr:hypothetical protein AMAG_15918 [Allomyces macrogynus ATCC 38327]|eukprot:KNE71976.1 hypothetical protein AMAG_15918 [Allomyces macrogynus ATCC 38327]
MTRLLILHLALVGALLVLAAMTTAARSAVIVAPGTDALAVAKKSSGGGKVDYAKDDEVTHVTRLRRAVGRDEIQPKKTFAKDEGVVRNDRIKGQSGQGVNRDVLKKAPAQSDGVARVDRIETGRFNAGGKTGE